MMSHISMLSAQSSDCRMPLVALSGNTQGMKTEQYACIFTLMLHNRKTFTKKLLDHFWFNLWIWRSCWNSDLLQSLLPPDLSVARDPAFTDWGFGVFFFLNFSLCSVEVFLKFCNFRVKMERKCTNDKHSKNNSTNSSHLHLPFGSLMLSEIIRWVKYLLFEIS